MLAVVLLVALALVGGFAPVGATGEGRVQDPLPPGDRAALDRWGGTATPADSAPTTSRAARNRCGKVLVKPNGRRWRCSFVDNFAGTQLNRDKWIVQQTHETGFYTGLTCYQDDPSTVAVGNGKLRVSVRKARREFSCRLPGGRFSTPYSGGMVGTRTKFSQTYGRWEVRAKFPTAQRVSGLHGGYWMYPFEQTYGPWPESGEIDVAEWWSKFPRRIIPSLHFDGRDRRVDSGRNCLVPKPTRFHTYRLLWTPKVMRFFVDGRQCFKRSWQPRLPQRAPQPFDHPFSFILHLGVGKAGGPHKVTDRTKVPATFVVDYAKAWR